MNSSDTNSEKSRIEVILQWILIVPSIYLFLTGLFSLSLFHLNIFFAGAGGFLILLATILLRGGIIYRKTAIFFRKKDKKTPLDIIKQCFLLLLGIFLIIMGDIFIFFCFWGGSYLVSPFIVLGALLNLLGTPILLVGVFYDNLRK